MEGHQHGQPQRRAQSGGAQQREKRLRKA